MNRLTRGPAHGQSSYGFFLVCMEAHATLPSTRTGIPSPPLSGPPYHKLIPLVLSIYTMADIHENGNHVAQAGGGKEAKVDEERLKKKIQRHYNMSAEQFLKVWYSVPHRAHI